MCDMVEIQIEIDAELKEDVEKILKDLGTDIQTVITMFLEQVALTGKLPFDVEKDKLPAPYSLIVKSEEDLIKKLQKAEKDIEEGRVHPVKETLEEIQKAFEGEAERLGLETEDDVVELIKEYRKEKKERTKK